MEGGRGDLAERNAAVVDVTVDAAGTVTDMSFREGDPSVHDRIRTLLTETLTFRPGLLNGEPVDAEITLTFTFDQPAGGERPIP